MHPYFFGDADKQLYGVYDAPRSSSFTDAGMLFCYPIGQEYMRSHWASRQLVSQLGRAGIHCMRFDYFGSGDSAGNSTEASLEQWQADVGTGLTELRDASGVTKISLVGLRFGASIAATTPLPDLAVKKLVLWDPVVNGAGYLAGLRDMQQSLLANLKPLQNKRAAGNPEEGEELLGFKYSASLIEQIEALNLLEVSDFSADQVFLVVSESKPEYDQLKEQLESRNLLAGYRQLSSSAAWNELAEIENALIANEAISAICGELGK